MRLQFRTKFALLVALQVLLLLGLIGYKQVTLATGERVLVRTAPVDPRDLFRGDYVALHYKISHLDRSIWAEGHYQKGQTVFVTLGREGRFRSAEAVSKAPPKDARLFLRARVTKVANQAMEAQYGIESYFTPEGKADALASASQKYKGLTAEISVDRHGRAVLRKVWPEPAGSASG